MPIVAKPDLIVSVGGPAALFARKYRRQLFPDSPLLFAAVDQRYLGDAPLGANETAVAVSNDFTRTIDDILQLLPETKQVFMVMGSGQLGRFWHEQLNEPFKRFRERLTFVWSDDLSLADVLRRCASLPAHSAIFYVVFGTDASGAAYADERVLAELHATANAPLFAAYSVQVGSGVVGGGRMSSDDLSRDTADAAVRLLNGASPGSIKMPLRKPGQPIFDWRELQRWGIPESRLPPGSVVLYRSPTLWQEHRGSVLSAAGAMAILMFLIVGLLLERRARQRAELDSRRNLALAADVGRRETMSALTHSITHELGQPLSSMIQNAQALQLMIAAGSATQDTIGEILSDIQAEGVLAAQIIERHRAMLRSHQLQKKPIDLHAVVKESLALVAHDMRARQIAVNVNLSCESLYDQWRPGAPAAGARDSGDERRGRDGRDAADPAAHHDHKRSQRRRCRSHRARRRSGFGGAYHRHAVHTIRHDEIAWPRDRPHDRADDRQRSRRHHRGPQQSRRRRDIHGHAARARHRAPQTMWPRNSQCGPARSRTLPTEG